MNISLPFRLICYLLFLVPACISVQTPSDFSSASFSKKAVIIFVPGYYGTALADAKTGERLHITFGKALFDGPPLTINSKVLGIPDGSEIRTDGILNKVTFIPAIYSVDIHESLIERLTDTFPAARVVTFPYDWRDSNIKSARELAALVTKLRKAGAAKISIVAYSNGGAVTSYYMRYGNQDPLSASEDWAGAREIDSVIFIGTPFRGSMQSFYNAQHGVKFGFAKTPLNPIAMASFPSLYELLPFAAEDSFINSDNENITSQVYLPRNWRRNGWGFFKHAKALSQETLNRREHYLAEKLQNGRLYSRRLLAENEQSSRLNLPALVIIGKGKRTLEQAKWSKATLDHTGEWNFSHKTLYADGDGTVSYKSARPPKAYQNALDMQETELTIEHAKMLTDSLVWNKIKEFLKQQNY